MMNAFFLIAFTLIFGYTSGVDVTTKYGVVRGQTVELNTGVKINTYLGIPFAKPPIGDLRWKVAEEPEPWSSPLIADRVRSMCPQEPSLIGISNPGFSDYDEDCLNLNIYAPNASSNLLPVMVYFYGGSYFQGGNVQYNGHFLAAKDVVVVVPNYRTYILGFMTTGDAAVTPNLGMLDQVQTLRFVQENIAAFGGDPNHVTIVGQSAGASSVGLHLVSEKSAGLYHGAICQSGNEFSRWGYARKDQRPEKLTRSVAEKLGCNRTSSVDMVECLRRVNASTLIQTYPESLPDTPELWFTPVIDGEGGFLADDPRDLRDAGRYNRVPLLAGITAEDGSLALLASVGGEFGPLNRTQYEQHLRSTLASLFPDVSPYRLEQIYRAYQHQYTDWPHVDDAEANRQSIVKLNTDQIYGVANDQQLKSHSRDSPSYMYVFNYRSANVTEESLPSWMGVTHGVDMFYVFGRPMLQLNPAVAKETRLVSLVDYNDEDREFSNYVISLFTNFVKTWNPTPQPVSAPGSNPPTTWDAFDNTKLSYLLLQREVKNNESYRQRNVALWINYLAWLLEHQISAFGEILSALQNTVVD